MAATNYGDPRGLLDTAVPRLARDLADTLTQDSLDTAAPDVVEALQVLTAVHGIRCQILSEGRDQELQACLKWSAVLLPVAPSLVPEPMRAYLAGPDTLADDTDDDTDPDPNRPRGRPVRRTTSGPGTYGISRPPSSFSARLSSPPRPTTPTAPGTCPTWAPRCGPGSSAPGSRRTWTRPSRFVRGRRCHPGRRPRLPGPARVPVQPGHRAAGPVRAHRGAGGPGPAITLTPEAVDATPGRPPRPARTPVQPRRRAAGPVRAHRAAGGPGPGHYRRPGGRRRHPAPATPTGPVPVQPRRRAADPVRAHRGAARTWTAIDAQSEAVDATPADHPDRAMYLSNLGDRAAGPVRAHRDSGGP